MLQIAPVIRVAQLKQSQQEGEEECGRAQRQEQTNQAGFLPARRSDEVSVLIWGW